MMALLHNMYFIQGLGFVAFAFGVLAVLSHDDVRFKLLLAAQGTVLGVHFILLGAGSGAMVAFVASARNVLSLYFNLKHVCFVFMALFILLGASRYDVWVDILPIIASVTTTYAMFNFDKVRMRSVFLFGTGLWVVHNAVVWSIGPFFMECFMFAANLRTILALRRKGIGDGL